MFLIGLTLWLFAISKAFATIPGPYIGGQLGWADLHQGDYIASHLNSLFEKAVPSLSIDSLNILYINTGLAGRVFLGYQFNSYFAAEVGYYRFTQLDVNTKLDIDVIILKQNFTLPTSLSTRATVRTEALDLVAKGILPLTDKFSIYGKLGLAYLNVIGKVSLSVNSPLLNTSLSGNPSLNLVYPTFGIGANYDLTQHISTDLSWNRIQRLNSHLFPSTDFISLGLIYRFG